MNRTIANGFRKSVWFWLAAFIVNQTFAAETSGSLAEILRDANRDFTPDHLGDTVTLTGTLTSDPVPLIMYDRQYATVANLEDKTGGIMLFVRDRALLSPGFKRGDSVRVTGQLSQHNGTEELKVTELKLLGAGTLPEPREALITDLHGERYSGRLVRVFGELIVPSDLLSRRRDLMIKDRSGQIPVEISDRFFANPTFVNRLMQGKEVRLVGIAGQSDKDPPFDSGYRLIPRDQTDFGFVAIPPYKALAVTAALVTLLALSFLFWFRHRRAEGHAVELAKLTATLKQSEEALRQSEERFRRIFEDGPVGIVISTPDLKIVQVNRALCRTLGFEERELIGLGVADITHPEDTEYSLEQARKLFRGEVRGYQLEKRYVTKSRQTIWAKVTASLVCDRSGKPIYALGVIEDITGRKQTEEIVARSERRHRALIEKSSDSITLLDARGTVLYDAEPATLRNLGYSRDEMIGRNAADLLHPDDLPPTKRLFREVIRKAGATLTTQFRLRHKDQSWHWFEGTATNLLDDPVVGSIVINSRDITERRSSEEKLRQFEERFSKAFHASPVAISIATEEEGRFIDVNESFLHLTGYSREDLIGATALERNIWVEPADRTSIVAHLRSHGSIRSREGRFRTRSGEIREALASADLIDLDGRRCILCLVHDITERKQVEAALRKSEERFHLIAHATNDTIWDWDLKSNHVWWNEGIKTLFGYSEDEVGHDGNWWDGMIHPEDRERVLSDMRAVIDTGAQYWSAEYRYRRADGTYADVFDRGYILKDEQGEPVRMIGAMMDITERKGFIRELAAARDAALESARLKSEFLANISHEVRTPLNGIVGMTVLLQDSNLTPEQRAFAGTIQASADALLTIINDILDFSKIEAGKMRFETLDFDLQATVNSTMELLSERAARKHIELASLINKDVPTMLRGDPGRLRQVISNLVVNAIKFTDHGEVVLQVAREIESTTHATLCFTVKDTGIGIPQEALPHLFQAFYQADGTTTRKHGGTGLGLAISKQLVEVMGGQIGVESTPGKGSTFWFTVRLEKQPKAISARPKLAGQRTLVVDEHAAHRGALLQQLANLGLRADESGSADHALELLRAAASSPDPYSFAILDMQLTGTDGLSLARTIKSDPTIATTRLLLVTSVRPRSDTSILRTAGIGAFLTRPIKQADLADCLTGLDSAPGQHETRFRLKDRDGEPGNTDRTPAITGSLHVLVAEDNPINQKVAVGLLNKLGYRAEAVSNGLEVLKAMEVVVYDIIFMDCMLPELDGFKTTMEIRRREVQGNGQGRKRTHIVAMTAHAVPGARDQCLASGMDDYLSKPVQLEALRAVLDKAVRRATSTPAPAPSKDSPREETTLDRNALLTLRALRPGAMDPVTELSDLFLTEAPERIHEMEIAATRLDYGTLERLAHSLRGSAGSIGANRLVGLCARLEDEARARSVHMASHLIRQMQTELDRVREALAAPWPV